jgi:uncharacterized protein (TIRG00374 family)
MAKGRWLGFLFFPLCTAVGLYFAARFSGQSLGALWKLPALRTSTWIWLFLLSAGVYLADIWRFQICGRALGIRLSWLTCLEASVVSLFFAWITPGGALGAASAGFVLKRRANVGWDDALLLAFGKSLTGIAFLVAMAAACIVLGIGPEMSRGIILYPLLAGVAIYGFVIGVSLWAALYPEFVLGRLGRIRDRKFLGFPLSKVVIFFENTGRRLRFFLKDGKKTIVPLLASNALYFSAFILIATCVAYEFGARPFPLVFGISVVKTAAVYVAPTPGGAGISEMTAEAFYGGLLPPALAVSVVLLFRAFTFYSQIIVGLLYFGVAGGITQVFKFAEENKK